MLQNYLKVAWRNLLKHRSFSLINIMGLAIGIGACMMIFLYVHNELTYDLYNLKVDRIARVTTTLHTPESDIALATSPAPMADVIMRDFPEVESTVRIQNVDQVIRPALDAGRIVLCDRFTDSTMVYQGWGRGLDVDVVRDLDRIACRGLKPDVTFLIDIDLETSLMRARRRNERLGPSESRIDEESAAFHERVRQGYLALAKAEPERVVVIDGAAGISEVGERIRQGLHSRGVTRV